MADRPIIFSAPMVRALLDGRKSMTRRVMKPRGKQREWADFSVCPAARIEKGWIAFDHPGGGPYTCTPQPYAVGDRLWVREAWALLPRNCYALPKTPAPDPDMAAYYRTDFDRSGKPRWRPSIHMPRWASRLTLTVTAVKVERLQEISEADARAEGLRCVSKDGGKVWKWGLPDRDGLPGNDDDGWHWCDWSNDHREAFARLWTSLHGPGAWKANPWIAAITFDVHKRNIDQMAAADA